MKTFLLIILSILPLFSKSQISFQVSPNYFIGSAVVFDENSSFTDFRKESKLFNLSKSYGVSGILMFRNHYSYYQAKQYGLKLSILKSTSTQKIVYDPTPNTNLSDITSVTNTYSFIEIPLLFTKGSTNHQIFIFELGPVYSYLIKERLNRIGAMGKIGIYNHISKDISYSILLCSNNTKMGRNYWRLSNGLELNLIYTVTK
jgi:hypothetical protein